MSPGVQGAGLGEAVPVTGCQPPALVTGPLSSVPSGVSRYPRLPVSTSADEFAVPLTLWPGPAPGTAAHWSLPGEAEYSDEDVQPAAKSGPVPEHCAHTAKTRWPAASSAVTRSPWVLIRVQCSPPSWVAHSCGPKAQPSLVL